MSSRALIDFTTLGRLETCSNGSRIISLAGLVAHVINDR